MRGSITSLPFVFSLSLLGAFFPFSCGSAASPERPNVLLIFTDDHRFSGVHALSGLPVQTPNIDRLASTGVVFTKTYLQGSMSGATCIPSRHSLLTGRGVFDMEGNGSHIPTSSIMAGEAFRGAGYRTYHVGKWHNDRQALARFADDGRAVRAFAYLKDHFRMPIYDWDPSGAYPSENAYLPFYDEAGQVARRPLNDQDQPGPTGTEKDGPHSSELIAEGAIDLIQQHNSETPFFMYLAFHAPHDPRQSPEAYRQLYPPESIKLPPSYLPQHPFDNGDMAIRDEKLAPWPRTPEIVRQELADYYAIITHMDAEIGRVLDALEASALADNTIIVFAGDSGLAVGNHGLMGKQSLYDDSGIHVPLIFSGAIKGEGKRIPALSYLHDVFPTLCELVGIEIPESVTGLSLAPVMDGKHSQVRDHTYHAYKQLMRAYRKGDFKLIEYFPAPDRGVVRGSRVTQLFHLAEDPWETTDVSFYPDHQKRLKELQAEMQAVAKEVGDAIESWD